MYFHTLTLLVTSLSALFITGCGGDQEDAGDSMPPAPAQAAPAAQVGTTPTSTATPVAPPPTDAAPAAISTAPAGPSESAPMDSPAQERILAAMQSYVIDNSANPKSLDELVARGYLKSLPPAPDGKKWVYNPEQLGVELADK